MAKVGEKEFLNQEGNLSDNAGPIYLSPDERANTREDQLVPLPPEKLTKDELIQAIMLKDPAVVGADLEKQEVKESRKHAKKLKLATDKPVTHKTVTLTSKALIQAVTITAPEAAGMLGGCPELKKKNLKPLQTTATKKKLKTTKVVTRRVKPGWKR